MVKKGFSARSRNRSYVQDNVRQPSGGIDDDFIFSTVHGCGSHFFRLDAKLGGTHWNA